MKALIHVIEAKRTELYKLANATDFSNPVILKVSKELDVLLNQFDKNSTNLCNGGVK